MRISRRDLRRRYSNSLVIDAGSQFSLRACSQANHAEKIIGSAEKNRVGREPEPQVFFFYALSHVSKTLFWTLMYRSI